MPRLYPKEGEIFLPLPQNPKYLASNHGRIWSLHFRRQMGSTPGNHYSTFTPAPDYKKTYVHRVVAEMFLGPAPDAKAQVNHKDGNKANNHVSNLEWVTQGDNVRHAFGAGLMKPRGRRGEDSSFAKLTWAHVREIRAYEGMTRMQLAKKYGVSWKNIDLILKNRTWVEPSPGTNASG